MSDQTHEHGAPSDEQLARQAGSGCPSAFSELIERFEPRVRGFVARYRLGSADTDDVVQETFLHAWAGIERYDPERRFSTWLLTIAARRAITQIRASTARRAAPIVEGDLAANGPEHAARQPGWTERGSVWEFAARELPTDHHAALWLRYVEDLNAKQIGAVLGKSQVAVRVMLFRARERLATALADAEHDGRPAARRAEHPPGPPSEPTSEPTSERGETGPGPRANTLKAAEASRRETARSVT